MFSVENRDSPLCPPSPLLRVQLKNCQYKKTLPQAVGRAVGLKGTRSSPGNISPCFADTPVMMWLLVCPHKPLAALP